LPLGRISPLLPLGHMSSHLFSWSFISTLHTA
jgi:hypothetical protein